MRKEDKDKGKCSYCRGIKIMAVQRSIATHPSSSPSTSYTTQTHSSKSTTTKPSYLIIFFNKLFLLFFTVMPKHLFPPSISLRLLGGESLGCMSLKWDLSKFLTTLTFLPLLSEGQLQRDIKRARRMRVEEDILMLGYSRRFHIYNSGTTRMVLDQDVLCLESVWNYER